MRRSVRAVAAIGLAIAPGCSGTPAPTLGAPAVFDGESGSGGSGTDAASTSTSAGSTAALDTGPTGPPIVVDIGKDASTLTEGGAIVVTATVRDPDGDEDVTGGWLVLADTDLEVAPFQRGDNGRFTAPLSWDDLKRLDPPSFEASSTLRLLGRFTDRSGATAEGETSVLMVCAGLSGAACDGTCVDLEAHDEHCGECGHACETMRSPVGSVVLGGCDHGTCEPTLVACASSSRFPDCTAVCAEHDRRCAVGCDGGFVAFTDDACSQDAQHPGSTGCDPEPLGWPPDGGSVQCCCAAPP